MFMCIFEVAGDVIEAMPKSEYEKRKKRQNKSTNNLDDDQIELTDIKISKSDDFYKVRDKRNHSFIFKKVQAKRFR